MATKADLVKVGFDPSYLDKVVADFGAVSDVVLQAMADLKKLGFGVAWIVDLINLAGPVGVKFVQDLIGLFGTPTPVVRSAMAHATAKQATATAGAHPFLDWLLANGPALLALVLKILGLAVPTPVTP